MGEFDLIRRFFTRPTPKAVLGVGDDCALLQSAPGMQTAISTDMLVVATPDTLHFRHMADTARTLNPDIEILLRSHSEDDTLLLTKEGIGLVFFGEEELAKGMSAHVGSRFPS